MSAIRYKWSDGELTRMLELVHVEGTSGRPYVFGEGDQTRHIDVQDFFIATTPVTQALWAHVMDGDNPSCYQGPDLPLENVSWDAIKAPSGFLQRLNESVTGQRLLAQAAIANAVFRLPSETEWEYAARGGTYWTDGFRFSGSNDIDLVAWYDRMAGDPACRPERAQPTRDL
jgi:formylglycine-generating enzyme